MSGPLLLGGADGAALAAHGRALAEAERRWDVAAAMRAARACGDAVEAYADLVRGDAGALSGPSPSTAAVEPAVGDLAPLLARLVAGELTALHFLEFGPDEGMRVTVTADRAGVPAEPQPVRLPWNTAVLGADPYLRRFRLAGGVGRHAIDRTAFDDALTRQVRPLTQPGEAVVLVRRHAGWTLLDRACDLTRQHCRPAAELVNAAGAPLTELVAALVRRAPLAYDYVLLGTALDEDSGRVDLVTHTVFPAGTVVPADRPLSQEFTVYGPPVAVPAPTITLPLLARRGVEPADWPVVHLPRAEVATRDSETVTVTLAGPGKVRCSIGGTDLAAADSGSLRQGLQRRTMKLPVPPPLDVVCLVELCGGSRDEVRGRLGVAVHTLDQLAERYATRGGLRVGAVGYYDHVLTEAPAARQRELFRVVEFAEPAFARSQIAGWRPAERQRDYATSVGDALGKAGRLRWRRDNPAVQRAVLLIGRRPPEARPGSPDVIPLCPCQTDWKVEWNRLRSLGVRPVARIDLPADWPGVDGAGRYAHGYAETAWRQLAADNLFREDGRPEDLADRLSSGPDTDETRVFPFPFLTPLKGGIR
jgi:hypothetical protein